MDIIGVENQNIPDETRKRIETGVDMERTAKARVESTIELIDQVWAWSGGVYIMPQFHKFDMVAEIIEAIR